MSTLSIRLSDDLEQRLEQEAELSQKKRSALVREAIVEHLQRLERERFMSEFLTEVETAYSEPALREEALVLAEEAIKLDNEALDLAESHKPGEPWPEELGERWWK